MKNSILKGLFWYKECIIIWAVEKCVITHFSQQGTEFKSTF